MSGAVVVVAFNMLCRPERQLIACQTYPPVMPEGQLSYPQIILSGEKGGGRGRREVGGGRAKRCEK